MNIFQRIIRRPTQKRSFDDFFNNASPKERERLMKEVMRKANEDQRRVIEKYDRLHPKTT
ncbi:MAG: hypothetical protein Q7S02_01535 [bacterium]|nr:hypothetical protein [bacterium]